jgi:Ca2+-transporting ATPase
MRRKIPLSRINYSLSSDWNLSNADAKKRRSEYGTNDIVEVHTNRWLELAINTAKDPMIWFLVATSLLFAILKNYDQAIILFAATIPLIGMDAFLHWRTQISTQSLRSHLATYATVIRSDSENTILAREIVPGDLVVVASGMPFPADGIIVAGKNIQVDESALTGEAFPVQKKMLTDIPLGASEFGIESDHWGFAGTRLLTGQVLLRVVFTGQESFYGEIVTSAMQSGQARTPLQIAIAKLVYVLIVTATIFCIILVWVRYAQGFGLVDAILSAATLAVAALPDEFPVVFTFFLGVGVYRLARKKALVRRAVSVENIGRITYICSDKTGTMTQGRFQLARYFPGKGFDEQYLLSLARLASRIESGDLLDLAIIEEANKQNLKSPECLATFPFTEDRKRETGISQYNSPHLQQFLVATKGAPETILSLLTLSQSEKQQLQKSVAELAALGYKIIACAQCVIKATPTQHVDHVEPQTDYQFVGLLAFSDPPRKGVPEAVKLCRDHNIRVLMITGDHPGTARAVACEIGLGGKNPKVILAEDVTAYLQKNGNNLRTVDVIARAIPSQKLEIVTTLQSWGEIVAVTGDGVNDVPALKAGDVGIAMGERGTQSAREIADIILLDDNFDSIVHAIAEGRQLFKNLQLSFKYLLMIHTPFVISAALIPLLGYPLLYYPIHIVFIELIIHPTSLLVFQDLPQNHNFGPAAPQTRIHLFSGIDKLQMVIIGILTTLVVILSFTLHERVSVTYGRALAFAALCFTSVAITIGLVGFRSWPARIITSVTMIATILVIQSTATAKFFYFTPLHRYDWFSIIIVSLVTYAIVNNFRRN